MKKILILILVFVFLISNVSAYKIYYYHNDHLGNPVAITNQEGEVVWKADYEPFGFIFNEENIDTSNKYNYNTKELDKNTNLLYYGNRYYDADIGRFTTADTIKGSLSAPQSLNRYSYTLNNPMKYIDPSGNAEKPIAVLFYHSKYPEFKQEVQQYMANNKANFEFRVFSVHGREEIESAINSVNELIAQGRDVQRVNYFDHIGEIMFGMTSDEWAFLPQITPQVGRKSVLGTCHGGEEGLSMESTIRNMIYISGAEEGIGVKSAFYGIPRNPDKTKSDIENLLLLDSITKTLLFSSNDRERAMKYYLSLDPYNQRASVYYAFLSHTMLDLKQEYQIFKNTATFKIAGQSDLGIIPAPQLPIISLPSPEVTSSLRGGY